MALRLKDKEAIVADLAEVVSSSVSAVTADYRGLTVTEMTKLRNTARENGVHMQVVRNTLARRAVEGTDYACLQEALVGPLVLLFSKHEPGSAARLLRDFAKDHDNIAVRSIALNGELHGPDSLEAIASLPSRDEGLALLMSVMQAPIVKLARTLNEIPASVTRVMDAVSNQKQA